MLSIVVSDVNIFTHLMFFSIYDASTLQCFEVIGASVHQAV